MPCHDRQIDGTLSLANLHHASKSEADGQGMPYVLLACGSPYNGLLVPSLVQAGSHCARARLQCVCAGDLGHASMYLATDPADAGTFSSGSMRSPVDWGVL